MHYFLVVQINFLDTNQKIRFKKTMTIQKIIIVTFVGGNIIKTFVS